MYTNNSIYCSPLPATRKGALFNAHAYSTKIDPEAAGLLIATHTKPRDAVFDGFGGSCTTALGSLLCSQPTSEMIASAKRMRLPVAWGPRHAVIYELSGLGSFLGQALCARPDADRFRETAEAILCQCEGEYGWMYRARDDQNSQGSIRYIIWSECIRCRRCRSETSFWHSSVRLDPAQISGEFTCRRCGYGERINGQQRSTAKRFDEVLGTEVSARKRVLARVYGTTSGRCWSRDPTKADRQLIERIEETEIPAAFPVAAMMGKGGVNWGDLYRSGYHEGITHVHHFYTRRNLIAVASVNQLIAQAATDQRDILSLWLSSYNASHSTLMSRVVAKRGQRDLVTTSNQPGVLYVSGLPVEKNVFEGLRRKIKTIANALECLQGTDGTVEIHQASCTKTHLADGSVDYVFTDPPFGGNIPYSEANFINESWLGRYTDAQKEAIVSPAQGKDLSGYQRLLTEAFSELHRIMKPNAKATVVFHSTDRSVWNAFVTAFRAAQFSVEASSVLDKTQASFKQVTAPYSVKGDALLLLTKAAISKCEPPQQVQAILRELVADALRKRNSQEESPQRLYARFVERFVARHCEPPLGATDFYKRLEQDFVQDGRLSLSK